MLKKLVFSALLGVVAITNIACADGYNIFKNLFTNIKNIKYDRTYYSHPVSYLDILSILTSHSKNSFSHIHTFTNEVIERDAATGEDPVRNVRASHFSRENNLARHALNYALSPVGVAAAWFTIRKSGLSQKGLKYCGVSASRSNTIHQSLDNGFYTNLLIAGAVNLRTIDPSVGGSRPHVALTLCTGTATTLAARHTVFGKRAVRFIDTSTAGKIYSNVTGCKLSNAAQFGLTAAGSYGLQWAYNQANAARKP